MVLGKSLPTRLSEGEAIASFLRCYLPMEKLLLSKFSVDLIGTNGLKQRLHINEKTMDARDFFR